MITDRVNETLRDQMGRAVGLVAQDTDTFLVDAPFLFGDGDHFVVRLVHGDGEWSFTDQGHTFMHLSYWTPEEEFGREPLRGAIRKILSRHAVEDRDGELVLRVRGGDYSGTLFAFLQALAEITGAATAAEPTNRNQLGPRT